MAHTHGQHYLLSAEARSLSLMQIMRLSDEQAFDMFKEARWGKGPVACPCCGGVEHYWLKNRSQWRCKHKECGKQFSITSGTIFHSAKMPLRVYLAAIALYSYCAKGMSALQMSRDLDVQYKTAFVLCHKMRESMVDVHTEKLTGTVEMDAAYVNKHVRPANKVEQRVDRRLAKNQNPKKRAIVVIRQRAASGRGADKTRTFMVNSENQKTTLKLALDNIDTSATIHADEHHAYDVLHAALPMQRVVHAEHYRGPQGQCTNQAESFFSRFRRMQYGQNHKFDNNYVDRYANEAAYREDTRRQSNGAIFKDILGRCAMHLPSRDFCGYWQGNHRTGEALVAG